MQSRWLPPDVNWRVDLLRRRTARLPAQGAGSIAPPRARWRRTWRFPTEAAARRWNAEWDEILERPGASHPALLRIAGSAIQDPLVDVLARLAGCVLAEEARAGAPYPFMRVGRTYTLGIRSTPYQSRRADSEPSLVFSVRSEVVDPDGELIWASDATRQYPAHVVPSALAELWHRRRLKPTDEVYG
jgi:hypothetical protein